MECTCSPQRLAAYSMKLSRALLDRFDLVVHMPRPRGRELDARNRSRPPTYGCGSNGRGSICAGNDRISERRRADSSRRPWTRCRSPRAGRARVLRVAATVAALAGRRLDRAEQHLAEALSYRTPRELSP